MFVEMTANCKPPLMLTRSFLNIPSEYCVSPTEHLTATSNDIYEENVSLSLSRTILLRVASLPCSMITPKLEI